MRFQCEKGHTWETNSHTLKKGAWCRHCHHESMKNTLEDMHRLAKKRGGKCLAKEYVRNNYPIKWECELGHKFMAQPANITVGEWCPQCARDKQRLSIDDVQQTAEERGGRLISKRYNSNHEKLEFECEDGHRWFAAVSNVRHGAWCPVCAGNRPKTLLDMHRIAKERGGKCSAREYKNQTEKLSWVCSQGHHFELPPTKILHRGQWCPQCSSKHKYTVEDVQKIAKESGGVLLSKTYQNNHTELLWRCRKCDQKFHRTLKDVLQKGRWCKGCPSS